MMEEEDEEREEERKGGGEDIQFTSHQHTTYNNITSC